MGDGGRDEQEPQTPTARNVPTAQRDVPPDVPPDVPSEFVAALFAQLDVTLDALQGLAWSALSPAEVRATVRGLTARPGRMESARLPGLASMDARDDVVPKARAGQASIAFQQHALGVDHHTARRDSTTAHLLDPDTGDLKTIGAAFAAGRCCAGMWTSRSAPTATSARRSAKN